MNVKALVTKFSRQTEFFFFTKFPLKSTDGNAANPDFLNSFNTLNEQKV